ncbi:CchlQ [Streptomyces sp. NPDC000594]|uniref:CchlQ n=1 Tax=Streptomyces sp. NPDC000594 TaxID=3154261 RepID=UPI0033335D0D
MDWGTLAATASGGFIAMAGTVLVDGLRSRQEARQSGDERRRAVYTDFIGAAGECHAELRRIARRPAEHPDPAGAARDALRTAAVHEVRERLFIEATTAVAGAGQAMFERLRALQRVVGSGAAQESAEFHAAYHPYLDAVWAYRVAVRKELSGGRTLAPAAFGWEEWDAAERCPHCRAALPPGTDDRVTALSPPERA